MIKQGVLAEVHPLSQETGNGSSPAFKSQGESLGVAIYVSAVATSIAIELEWSADGQNWGSADGTADTLTTITAVGSAAKAFTVKAPYYRITWTLVGGNSTFLVTTH